MLVGSEHARLLHLVRDEEEEDHMLVGSEHARLLHLVRDEDSTRTTMALEHVIVICISCGSEKYIIS
jgi:hypothetical protein